MTNRPLLHRASPLVLGMLVALGCSSQPNAPPATDAPGQPDTQGPSDVSPAPDGYDEAVGGSADSVALPSVDAAADSAADAATEAAAGDAIEAADRLVDDFEDGDQASLIGQGWYVYTDVDNGGGSTIQIARAADGSMMMTGAGHRSQRSLSLGYAFEQAELPYTPYIGFGVSLGTTTAPLDASRHAGIAYTYRGGAHRVRVETTEVADYDFFGIELPASATWSTVQIPFKGLHQEGFGAPVSFDARHVSAISFQARGDTGTSGTLDIDDLTIIAKLPETTPDMEIRPPSIPADQVLPSVDIPNPLQAKAQKYLDRGYNVTNWLEEKRFSGFTYDEEFVANLARAGFKSLRLPIDLDLYVDQRTGSGETLQLTVHPDLFGVLDAFSTWTAAHGLSLTIDYHQYDRSFDVSKPDSVAEAVALWTLVAEHFAANEREDLFFELMNEPELSSKTSRPPTQAEWTAVAERMIGGIRKHDAKHTIIFGDVEWYGITPLSKRQPLTDANVVYAFHDYEPFIFTHQGAAWANMGASHDIPYPYSPDRWSRSYSDLGFNAFQEPWMLDLVQNYYRSGNRAALRNRVVEAKRWAVQHDVPIICNEFGAYAQRSRSEDRLNYYKDLIGIFDELRIPWQHWFMIMDDQGAVPADLRTAFRLGT